MDLELFADGGMYSGLHELDFGVRAGDRVVDVGGGHRPYHQATHVIDLVDNNQQRHNQELNVGDRVLLEGDVCSVLPGLPDDYFDFCYSSHTFEHIADLPRALDLISAKCKRGFYALPASDFELLTNRRQHGHVNMCRLLGGILHICRRPDHTVVERMADLFTERLFMHPEFNRLWEGHGCRGYRFIWEARHYWEGEIRYVFHEDPVDLYPQLAYFRRPTQLPDPLVPG